MLVPKRKKPLKPLMRFLPDIFKEESVDDIGIGDSFDLIFFQNNTSNTRQSEYDFIQIQNGVLRQNQFKNSFQTKNTKQKSIENDNRPTTFYRKQQKQPSPRPISIQPFANNSQKYSSIKQMYNQYGSNFVKNNPNQQYQVNRQPKPINVDSLKRINITYQQKDKIPRSNSQFIRYPSPINEPKIKFIQQKNNPCITIQKSAFTNNLQHIPVVSHRIPLKKLNTPSSPYISKLIPPEPQKRNFEGRSGKNEESQQQKNNMIRRVNPFEIEEKQILYQPKKKYCSPQPQQFNDYYEFTRPKRHEDDQTSSNASIKSKKSQKISVVSSQHLHFNKK